jgi:uncharacterized protein DUF6788
VKRAGIPEVSRRRRSRVAQLATTNRLLRGTLSVRKVSCGKANCCCATGEPHVALYLMQSKNGKSRQLYIPKELEQRVRKAIDDYKQLQELVEELSEEEWKLLKERRD